MKTQITLLASAFLMLTATSCKKGDGDPAFTVQSRKARISGQWTLVSIDSDWSNASNGQIYSSGSITATATELNMSQEYTTTTKSKETAKLNEYSITINKDGTWSSVIDKSFEHVYENDEYINTNTGSSKLVESGIWSFVNKSKGEYENKERVLFNVLASEETFGEGTAKEVHKTDPDNPILSNSLPYVDSKTFASGANTKIYDLVTLASKEMEWQLVKNQTNANYQQANPSGIYEGAYVFSETITWKAR